MKLNGNQLRALLEMFPDGCDVIEGRRFDQVHAEPLGDSERYQSGAKMRGVLIARRLRDDPTQAGVLGITRETYFNLPDTSESGISEATGGEHGEQPEPEGPGGVREGEQGAGDEAAAAGGGAVEGGRRSGRRGKPGPRRSPRPDSPGDVKPRRGLSDS